MPCLPMDMPGGSNAILCSRTRRRRCHDCGKLGATLLCDGPVAVGKTCDRPICASCATTDGPDRDYCRGGAAHTTGRQGRVSESVGQRIRRLRLARGWTQYELAAEAEITRYSLLRWEHGVKIPSVDNFARVAGALGVTLDELYRGEAGAE